MTEKEFIELLHKEEGRLLRIAWAILGQESDAWDALQETVEQAWRHRRELKGGKEAFPAWIKQIVVNRSLNLLRRRKSVIPLEQARELQLLSSDEIDPESRLIWEVVKELDVRHRQVIVLRYLGGLTLQDIALELKIPVGTVKSRLNTAHLRLKERLTEDKAQGGNQSEIRKDR